MMMGRKECAGRKQNLSSSFPNLSESGRLNENIRHIGSAVGNIRGHRQQEKPQSKIDRKY